MSTEATAMLSLPGDNYSSEIDPNILNGSFVYDSEECLEGALLDQAEIRYALIVAYILVFFLCLVGNMFTIIVICVHRSMRTATNFFLANLAFADLLVAIFCILQNMFHVVGSMNGHWPLGNMVCKLYVLVLHLVPCTGIGILICVSLEKYIAVLHPLLALKLLTPKLRIGMMIAIWTISLVINLPYYFTTKELQFGELASCARDMSGYGSISTRDIITVSFVVWYCIPLVTIAFLYTRIGMVLWKGQFKPLTIRYSNDTYSTGSAATTATTLQVCNNGETGTTLSPGTLNGGSKVHDEGQPGVGGGSTIYSEVLESRKKIIRLLIAIVSSFAILTFPHHARLLYLMYTHGEMCTSSWTALVQPATYICLFLSSSVNPFLYAFMSQRFRGAVRDLLKCRVGKMQRKYTRTRTLLSDVVSSRSPSLTRLNGHHHYTPSSSANNLNATHQNGHSNFLNHFLSVKIPHGRSHQQKQNSLMVENGAKMKLIRSESGDPTPGYRTRQNKNDAKRSNKSLYRNSRI